MIKASPKSFARVAAKSLTANQAMLVKDLLPKLSLSEQTNFNNFAHYKKVILEIGSGNGDFILGKALQYPDCLFIAVEPYMQGVASLLNKIKQNNLSNIVIFAGDVNLLFNFLPRYYVNGVYVICPDPWPKSKHHKRRLLKASFFEHLIKYLTDDATLTIATDHFNYAQYVLDNLIKSDKFELPSLNLEDYLNAPPSWIYTKYQKKAIKTGSKLYYFSLYIK